MTSGGTAGWISSSFLLQFLQQQIIIQLKIHCIKSPSFNYNKRPHYFSPPSYLWLWDIVLGNWARCHQLNNLLVSETTAVIIKTHICVLKTRLYLFKLRIYNVLRYHFEFPLQKTPPLTSDRAQWPGLTNAFFSLMWCKEHPLWTLTSASYSPEAYKTMTFFPDSSFLRANFISVVEVKLYVKWYVWNCWQKHGQNWIK